MLDALMTETVTLRRPKPGTREVSGKVQLAEVLDEVECQVPLRCKIEARGRRVIDSRGVETRGDAQMVYRVTGKPEVLLEDFVVMKDGRTWKVISLEEQQMLAGGAKYGRADLQRTEIKLPLDKHTYDGGAP
jgi:hypothetical protein